MNTTVTLQELRKKIALIENTTQVSEKSIISSPDFTDIFASSFSSTNSQEFSEQAAFEKIMRITTKREHSRKEVLGKLLKDGYSEDTANAAVERALRCGYINNERFTEILIRSRISQGKGKKGILKELESHEITSSEIEKALYVFEEFESEYNRAAKVLDKYSTHSKNKCHSAYCYLVRKGFSSDIASALARKKYPFTK